MVMVNTHYTTVVVNYYPPYLDKNPVNKSNIYNITWKTIKTLHLNSHIETSTLYSYICNNMSISQNISQTYKHEKNSTNFQWLLIIQVKEHELKI